MSGTWISRYSKELNKEDIIVAKLIVDWGTKPFTSNQLVAKYGLIKHKIIVLRGISRLHFLGLIREVDRTRLFHDNSTCTTTTCSEAVYRCSGLYRERLYMVILNNYTLDCLGNFDINLHLFPHHIDRRLKVENAKVLLSGNRFVLDLGPSDATNLVGYNVSALLKAQI